MWANWTASLDVDLHKLDLGHGPLRKEEIKDQAGEQSWGRPRKDGVMAESAKHSRS